MAQTHRFLVGTAFCCCGLVVSCGPKASEKRATELPRHAVESQRLRAIMTAMQEQVQETWPQEIAPLKKQQARTADEARFGEVAHVASQLANSAHSIPDAVPEQALSGPDRQRFLRLVAELESRASSLGTAANQHNQGDMEAEMRRVRATCRDCHSEFRDVAGHLRWGQ